MTEMIESPTLTRRRFFQALACSALAAGAALPLGMPREAVTAVPAYLTDPDAWFLAISQRIQARLSEEIQQLLICHHARALKAQALT